MVEANDCALLVVQDEPHFFDGRMYRSEMNFGYFVDWVARQMQRATLAVPTTDKGEQFGQPLDLPNVSFEQLPYWWSLISYLKLGKSDKRRLKMQARELVAKHDAVMVRLPSLPARLFANEARKQNKALITYVGGNILTAANPLQSRNPLIRVAAQAMSRYVHHVTMRMVGQADVALATGREIFGLCDGRAKMTRQLMTSLVSQSDMFAREDSIPETGPIKMFRAARVNPNKGTEYLLKATAMLVERGCDVQLQLAGGWNEDAYVDELKAWCKEHEIEDRVEWLGHIDFGPGVLKLYREAHIGVLSSLSEGFPRFILEAWGLSLPVVATDLPGMCPPVEPNVNAILVERASAKALADGIQRVIDDPSLRRSLISNGMEIATNNSAEMQSERVAGWIANAAAERKKD